MQKTLEKEVKSLRCEVVELKTKNTQLETQAEQLETQTERLETKLQHVIEEREAIIQLYLDAQRQAFGKKSERFVDSQQMPLFDKGSDQADQESESAQEDTEDITYTRRKRKSRQADLDALPQREEIIAAEESEKICSCGDQKQLIGYEKKRILN